MNTRLFFLYTLSFLLIAVSGCSSVLLEHPGTNKGVFNESLLDKSTGQAIDKSELPLNVLTNKKVFLDIRSADNEGKIVAYLLPIMQKQNTVVVSNMDKADFVLRIAEKSSGVNSVRRNFWWTLGVISWNSDAESSQAKTKLYIQLVDNKRKAVVHSQLGESQMLYGDRIRNSDFWILFFPIPAERYVSSGEITEEQSMLGSLMGLGDKNRPTSQDKDIKEKKK